MPKAWVTVKYRRNFEGGRVFRKEGQRWTPVCDVDCCGAPVPFDLPAGDYRVMVKEGNIWRKELEFSHA